MSVEQAIHERLEQLQRVSAGHQAMHQELTTLRRMVGTRSRVRLVEPKTLMPGQIAPRVKESVLKTELERKKTHKQGWSTSGDDES